MRCRPTSDGGQGAAVGVRAWAAIDQVCRPTSAQGPTAPSISLTSVHFLNSRTGWVAGRTCRPATSGNCRGLIEKTVNGGATWSVEYEGGLPIQSLQFTGPSYGWALVASGPCVSIGCPTADLLATSNGGQSWSPVYSGAEPLEAVTLTGTGSGWAWMSTSKCAQDSLPASVPPRCSGQLVRSTDGGRKWQASIATSYPVGAVDFVGGHGWAVELGPRTPAPDSHSTTAPLGYSTTMPVTVLASSDGGSSWSELSEIELPAYQTGLEAQLAFANEDQGAVSFCQPGSFGMHGSCNLGLFGTSDGGRTWTAPGFSGTAPPSDCSTGAVWSLAPSGSLAMAQPVNFGACSPVVTFSVGSVEHLAEVRQFDAGSPAALDWLSAHLGFALIGSQPTNQEAVARTVDGGKTWQQVFPAPTPTVAVDFLSGTSGVGIGDIISPGAVLTSSDGGRDWQARSELGGYAIAVSALSADLIYAEYQPFTGPDAGRVVVARSDDGGSDFVRLSSVGTGRVGAGQPVGMWPGLPYSGTPLRFVSRNVGFLATQAGILETRDGGRSWALSMRQPQLPCKDSYCSRLVETADVLSAKVTLLDLMPPPAGLVRTVDGGASWRVLDPSPQFEAVDFLNPHLGWAWSSGALLRTEDSGKHWTLYVAPWGSSQVTSVDFVDSGNGWVTTASGLWTTSDGGGSWSLVGGSSWSA